jgi:hypothetical protein
MPEVIHIVNGRRADFGITEQRRLELSRAGADHREAVRGRKLMMVWPLRLPLSLLIGEFSERPGAGKARDVCAAEENLFWV